jgi:hypothetical protein
MSDADEFLTPAETASLLKVTPQTLANWRYKKTGPHFTKLSPGRGGRIRYRRREIEQWLAR